MRAQSKAEYFWSTCRLQIGIPFLTDDKATASVQHPTCGAMLTIRRTDAQWSQNEDRRSRCISSLLALHNVHAVVAAIDWMHTVDTAGSGQMMPQGCKPVSQLAVLGIQSCPKPCSEEPGTSKPSKLCNHAVVPNNRAPQMPKLDAEMKPPSFLTFGSSMYW